MLSLEDNPGVVKENMAFNQQELQAEFSSYAENWPKISTHCHQLPGRELKAFDLEAILRNSYVNWCGVAWDSSLESRRAFLEKVHQNSYFVWLQKSLLRLYGESTPLKISSWQDWSERIQSAYRQPSHPRQILAERCSHRGMLLDAYWNPGSDNDSPEFYAPVYRVNAFFFGYSASARDHDGNNPYNLYQRTFITDLDEYIGWVRQSIISHKATGSVALKIPIAYDRGLNFKEVPIERARRAFARLVASNAREPLQTGRNGLAQAIPSNLPTTGGKNEVTDPGDVKTFQDFLFYQICSLAAELDLPVQIHTGMGQGCRTNAAQLQQAIQRLPSTRFVLLHCSYPWIQDMGMLVDKYPNVHPDLSMLPLISTRASIAVLHEMIERATLERIFWGCDTWTAEESFGALLAFSQTLSTALAEKVLDGYFTREDALLFMDNILFHNPQSFYKLASAESNRQEVNLPK
jgi:predicted TIM-barrel fold metal-dependent hydrolase